MAFWRNLERLTGIYAVMHVAGLVGDGVDYMFGISERKERQERLQRRLLREQYQYTLKQGLTSEQELAIQKLQKGSKLEEVSQDEQDDLQRKLQIAVFKEESKRNANKYGDDRFENDLLNRNSYFPERSRTTVRMYYWDMKNPNGVKLLIDSFEKSKARMYSALSPLDWRGHEERLARNKIDIHERHQRKYAFKVVLEKSPVLQKQMREAA